jgi:hypothetical protein
MSREVPHIEQRSGERYSVVLPVETDKGPGKTRDVSLSGLYLVTDRPLAIGDPLNLSLTLPARGGWTGLRLSVRGMVTRVERSQGKFGAGVVFDGQARFLACAP